MSRIIWPDNSPDSLYNICLEYCVGHVGKAISDNHRKDGLNSGLMLSHIVNQQLFLACVKAGVVTTKRVLNIFQGQNQTKLKRLNLSTVADLTDEDLDSLLLSHCPTELHLSSVHLTPQSLQVINRHGRSLVLLQVTNAAQIVLGGSKGCAASANSCQRLQCSNLRFLTLNRLMSESTKLLDVSLSNMSQLTLLDLSNSDIDVSEMECLRLLPCLQVLNLHSVGLRDLASAFKTIAEVKSLRVLDLGQSRQEEPVMYEGDVHGNMRYLISNLPLLTRLEIAGTNLAGRPEDVPVSHRPEKCKSTTEEEKNNKKQFAIPGLEGRSMEYLGLLNCAHNACERENLPAKQELCCPVLNLVGRRALCLSSGDKLLVLHVTGDVNEEQILLAVQSYVERQELLLMSLNHLFHLFKYSDCKNHKRALEGILAAMKAYKDEKTIQISGSATLFYIVKGDCKHFFTTKIKKELVKVLLDAMETHVNETTMLRNGCLTLCHFKIPQDVMHSYQRLVSLLLRIVFLPVQLQENFVQRISIYLLNSLACQVDHAEKELVGKLGAFKTMLSLIKEKLDRNVCDEVMEVAWSMMWNVTDETAVNCMRFIEEDGMAVFMKCLEKFPNEEELLRNMMGLMGNVAEVDYLRCQLLTPVYVPIFSELLDSSSDGIEVSYNACGVLAHLMSDGPGVWHIQTPSRDSVLRNMVQAICRWKLNTKRNINYRSFQPILRLLPNYSTPEVQHWAVWALCNLTKMYKSKYCPLLESENGLELLEELCGDPRPYAGIKVLANQVISRCRQFRDLPDYVSDDEQDASAPVAMWVD